MFLIISSALIAWLTFSLIVGLILARGFFTLSRPV